jgi:glycosyltransferase involved in cell wall biosynthesis
MREPVRRLTTDTSPQASSRDASRRRFLFVCTHLKTGGAERQWSILLPELHRQGFEVALLTLTAEGDFFPDVRAAGVATAFADMKSRTDVRGLARALAFRNWMPDAVITRSVLGQAIGHVLARSAGALHIATEHSSRPLAADHPNRERLRRLLAPRVDGVIAVTERQFPYLLDLGYRQERMLAVWSGIPALQAKRSRAEIRAELGLQADDYAAFLIATLRPEKRADVFIDAVARARESDGRIKGFIAGRGPELAGITKVAAEMNGAVEVLGSRSDIPDLMLAADAVCLTSDAEALPMVLIEAMALGRPVIATDVGGTSEIVVDGETGDLVQPGDVEALADNLVAWARAPQRPLAYGKAGLKRQQTLFTQERMARDYARAVEEFARNGRA